MSITVNGYKISEDSDGRYMIEGNRVLPAYDSLKDLIQLILTFKPKLSTANVEALSEEKADKAKNPVTGYKGDI